MWFARRIPTVRSSLALVLQLLATTGLRAQVTATPAAAPAPVPPPPELVQHVEIRRTAQGVPHIRADNLKAAYYALGYVQMEDYGARVAMGMLRSRGEMGKWFGRDSMESDFIARLAYQRAVEAWPRLEQDTRDAYEGFAVGVNRYI
jgi:acyl-homoserine-lactone acylase